MFGKTHTIRRITTGVALAASTAALATPAALADGKPSHGLWTDTTDSARVAWTQPTVSAKLPAGFTTDTLSSARVARSQARLAAAEQGYRFVTDTLGGNGHPASVPDVFERAAARAKAMPDVFERYAAAHPYGSGLRQAAQPVGYRFITDTLGGNGGPGAVVATPDGAFSWSSFAIGLGAGIASLLALVALAGRTGKLRRLASI